MDLLKALQLKALRNVHLEDAEKDYSIRRIFRWYSKAFHTPLHEVDALPLMHILTAYFEEMYEEMHEEDRALEVRKLTETDEEKKAREAVEAANSDEKFLEDAFLSDVAKTEQERLAQNKPHIVDGVQQKPNLVATEERTLIAPPGDEPDIKMEFASPEDFEREIEGFGAMGEPTD